MSILTVINEVAEEPSKNKKIEILEKNKDNELLKKVFLAGMNPNINYWIKKIPPFARSNNTPTNLNYAVEELSKLSTRVHTGHAGIDFLRNILSNLNRYDADVVCRIIDRDFKMGASAKTINKVWKKLIPETKVMLADTYNEKTKKDIKYPCYIQDKEDGMRFFAVVDGEDVCLKGRSGKPILLLGNLFEEFIALNKWNENKPTVYDGELLVEDDNGKILDRKTGNGILNKAIKGTIAEEQAKNVVCRIWDMIPYDKFVEGKYNIPETDRYLKLKENHLLTNYSSTKNKIKILKRRTVSSEKELMSRFSEAIKEGKEGLIVKSRHGRWVNKRSKDWLKMKAGFQDSEPREMDLLVTAWNEGTGKYKGLLGSLTVTNKDRTIEVNVGSGYTDDDRKLTEIETVGKIVTVKYGEIISSKGKEKNSLFLPVFVELRLDKSEED